MSGVEFFIFIFSNKYILSMIAQIVPHQPPIGDAEFFIFFLVISTFYLRVPKLFHISHLWVGWKYLSLFLIITTFYLSLPKLFRFSHLWVMPNFLSFFLTVSTLFVALFLFFHLSK